MAEAAFDFDAGRDDGGHALVAASAEVAAEAMRFQMGLRRVTCRSHGSGAREHDTEDRRGAWERALGVDRIEVPSLAIAKTAAAAARVLDAAVLHPAGEIDEDGEPVWVRWAIDADRERLCHVIRPDGVAVVDRPLAVALRYLALDVASFRFRIRSAGLLSLRQCVAPDAERIERSIATVRKFGGLRNHDWEYRRKVDR